MHRLEVIGNLAADAVVQNYNGGTFISFRVAHSEKFTKDGVSQEKTFWYSCTFGNAESKILPFLKKGQKVYVRGYPSYNLYDSQVHRCKMIDVSINVREIELCGANKETTAETPSPASEKAAVPTPDENKDKSNLPF